MPDIPNVPDTESQLRRYADQVEAGVGEVPMPAPSRPPLRVAFSRRAVALAVAVTVCIAVLVSLRADDRDAPVDRADVVVGGDEDAAVDAPGEAGTATTVPGVVRLEVDEAVGLLSDAGLGVRTVTVENPAPEGLVIAQLPLPGASAPDDGVVEITVSGGPEVVPVPDLTGLDSAAARALLTSAGFVTEPTIVFEPSDATAGTVLRTEPSANTLVGVWRQVELVLAAGDGVITPVVTDLFADTAIQTLRNAGFEVATVFEPVPEGSPDVGRVVAQDPAGGAAASMGSTVTITVGEASEAQGPITDVAAYRVVDGFLDALAAEDWEVAARYMNNGAADPRSLLEIGLEEESGDPWAPLLAEWCRQALCGAAYTLGEIDRTDGARMEVTFSTSTGAVSEWFRIVWFEGTTAVDHLPPVGVVGTPAASTVERLFGSSTTNEEFVIARTGSIIWSEGTREPILDIWTGRNGGLLDAAGGELFASASPITVVEDGFSREVSDLHYAGSSDADGGPTVFAYDFSMARLTAIELDGAGSVLVVDDSDREPQTYAVSVGDQLIAGLVGVGDSFWIEISERDGYTIVPGTAQIVGGAGSVGPMALAPDDSSVVALDAPDFWTPYDQVVEFAVDGTELGRWDLPSGEAFSQGIDFDGRWGIASLDSGRVFVVDTLAGTARVVDVYAQVFFD